MGLYWFLGLPGSVCLSACPSIRPSHSLLPSPSSFSSFLICFLYIFCVTQQSTIAELECVLYGKKYCPRQSFHLLGSWLSRWGSIEGTEMQILFTLHFCVVPLSIGKEAVQAILLIREQYYIDNFRLLISSFRHTIVSS